MQNLGLELEGFHMLATPPPDSARSSNNDPPSTRTGLTLQKFIDSPSMVIQGEEIPRRVLIKYVANKLGGSHFDERRGTTREDTLFHRLDCARSIIGLLG
jgi:hypothetical protein